MTFTTAPCSGWWKYIDRNALVLTYRWGNWSKKTSSHLLKHCTTVLAGQWGCLVVVPEHWSADWGKLMFERGPWFILWTSYWKMKSFKWTFVEKPLWHFRWNKDDKAHSLTPRGSEFPKGLQNLQNRHSSSQPVPPRRMVGSKAAMRGKRIMGSRDWLNSLGNSISAILGGWQWEGTVDKHSPLTKP